MTQSKKGKFKNPNKIKCFVCGKDIDITKATKDKNHEYVRFTRNNIYIHKNKCWLFYEKELSKDANR